MTRALAGLALALMGAVAIVGNINVPDPVLKADHTPRAAIAEPAAIALPDPSLTPGQVRTTDAAEICDGAGTAQFRHWSRERSDLIFERYHIATTDRMAYTLDHLVPLELGGADTVANIWPEPRRSLAGEWNDTRKDQLERRLHALVCAGQLDVREAQRAIAADWPSAYQHYVARESGNFFPAGAGAMTPK